MNKLIRVKFVCNESVVLEYYAHQMIFFNGVTILRFSLRCVCVDLV